MGSGMASGMRLALNVLLVEAKKSDIEAGVTQALGYMGKWPPISTML